MERTKIGIAPSLTCDVKSSRMVKFRRHLLPPLILGREVVQRVVVHPAALAAPADEDESIAEGDGPRMKRALQPQWHLGPLPPLHMAEGEYLDRGVGVTPY